MSSSNQLEINVDLSKAKADVQSFTRDLAAATAQAKELMAALADASGQQRRMLQGALAGTMARIGGLQSSIAAAQSSSVVGGINQLGMTQVGATGVFAQTQVMSPIMQAAMVQPMNTGTLQGQFGGSSYGTVASNYPTAWMNITGGASRFGGGPVPPGYSFDGTPDPTFATLHFTRSMPAGGGGAPSPGSMSMNPTVMYTPQQAQAANYGPFRQQMAVGAAYGAARVAGSYFDYVAARELSGGDDPTARAQGVAGGISTLVGLGVGLATRNPMAGVAAAGIANSVLGPVANWWAAPEAAGQNNSMAVRGFFGSYYGMEANSPAARSYSENTNAPWQPGSSRFAHLAQFVDPRLPAELQFGNQGAGVGQVFGNVAGSLFAGGLDPMRKVGGFSGVSYPWWNVGGRTPGAFMDDAYGQLSGRDPSKGFRLIDGLVDGSIGAIKATPRLYSEPEETLAGRYTRRLATLFGTEAKEQSKRVGSIFSSLPDTGGNLADILARHGPEDTATFLRIQSEDLVSSVDPMALSRASAGMRSADRAARLGARRPLGSGAAQKNAFGGKMLTIASLGPDAMDSESFADAYSGWRAARGEEFEQGTLSGFGLRDVQLSEQRRRMDVLPFAPGSIMGAEIGLINNRRGQIGRLNNMLQNTDLSERERYSYTAERERLITANYTGAATLSEGFENRLPALAAGRPEFAGRYNSIMGAAINLGNIGSPIRAYGAASGGQRAGQDAFVSALGGDTVPHSNMPYSRTSEMNTPLLQEMTGLLRQLVQNTRGGSGGTVGRNQPADAFGGVQGRQNKDVGQQQTAAWNSR